MRKIWSYIVFLLIGFIGGILAAPAKVKNIYNGKYKNKQRDNGSINQSFKPEKTKRRRKGK